MAVTDTRVAVLGKDALVDWISQRPEIGLQLVRVIARRLRRTNTMLADLIFVDVPGRVAKQLLQLAPEIIILSGYSTGNAVRTIYSDPALRGLPAVKTRHVYREPTGGNRMQGLIEDSLMLQWLAEVTHPEVAPRRFRQDVKATYAAVYGVTLSDDDIDATLRPDENSGAAGFDRFGRNTPSSHLK